MPFPVCIRQTLWEICLSMCFSSGFLQGRTWSCSPWISNSCGWKIYTRLVKKCCHESALSLQSYTEIQLLVLNAFLFSRQLQIRHWNHCYSSHKKCLESFHSGVYRCCENMEHVALCHPIGTSQWGLALLCFIGIWMQTVEPISASATLKSYWQLAEMRFIACLTVLTLYWTSGGSSLSCA